MTPSPGFAYLDGFFESPHDAPPKWLCVLNPILMYTAYLDETGQQSKDWIFVAGFLGKEDQWKCFVPRWKEALGSQRKTLHMNRLRWNKPSTKRLLATLGPIPRTCGLEAVAGGVKYSDYEDIITGTVVEKFSAGYLWCLFPLILSILKYLPPDERVELVFASQSIYRDRTLSLLSLMERQFVEDPRFKDCLAENGLPKLAKWSFVPYDSTILLQPSDYYAYAIAQYKQDKTSKKAKWCTPILGTPQSMPYIGRVLSRSEVRGQALRCKEQILPDLERHDIEWKRGDSCLPES